MDTVASNSNPPNSFTPGSKVAPDPGVNDVSIKPPHKQSWLWVVITMVLLALLGLLVFLIIDNQTLRRDLTQTEATPTPPRLAEVIDEGGSPSITPDPTANWQTYTNTRYEYSLKYPTDWIIEETNGPIASAIVPEEKNQMTVFSKADNNIKIFYEGDWDHGFEPWVPVFNQTTTIGDKTAQLTVMQLSKTTDPDGGWAVYTIPNFHSFRIEATHNEQTRQILSTFKFTD